MNPNEGYVVASEKDGLLILGRDLTQLAKLDLLDPVVGRSGELDEAIKVLCRRTKSNPLILGEPGVGKTALAEGLAHRLVSGDVPPRLRERRLFEVQLGSLLAGTQYRGDLEQRVRGLLELVGRERTILFIDEIHLLVQAGRGSGMDAANLLKPVLSRGEISCVGATTPVEARAMFAIDPAMERRFQPVWLKEPSPETMVSILGALRDRLEKHHGLSIDEAAIVAAVECSLEGASERRRNPDRAIDLLEETCASHQLLLSRHRAQKSSESAALVKLREELASAVLNLDLEGHARTSLALAAAERATDSVRDEKMFQIHADHVRATFLRNQAKEGPSESVAQ